MKNVNMLLRTKMIMIPKPLKRSINLGKSKFSKSISYSKMMKKVKNWKQQKCWRKPWTKSKRTVCHISHIISIQKKMILKAKKTEKRTKCRNSFSIRTNGRLNSHTKILTIMKLFFFSGKRKYNWLTSVKG